MNIENKSIYNFVLSLIIVCFINILSIHIGANSYCDLMAYNTLEPFRVIYTIVPPFLGWVNDVGKMFFRNIGRRT